MAQKRSLIHVRVETGGLTARQAEKKIQGVEADLKKKLPADVDFFVTSYEVGTEVIPLQIF